MVDKPTILIVDDDQELCFLLASVLQTLKADIFQAYTIRDATVLVEKIKPDLVMLDHRLPDGVGLQFVSVIQQYCPRTTVILMTGQGSKMLRQTAIDVGCKYFIDKPYNVNEIMKLVKFSLEQQTKVSL